VAGAGAEPVRWEVRAPTLDDVFLTLTGHAARTRDRDDVATATDHEGTAA
jgi:ABC-2 type transport system ATP-binding protein